MSSQKYVGVVVAAGRGRRMGRTKQLVPWPTADGEKPLVAAAFDAIRPACDEMIVVVGHEAAAVVAVLGDRPFHSVAANPDAPMFDSIRAGLAAARSRDPDATVVLQPGDQPHVAMSTLESLAESSKRRPLRAIIPQYGSEGGHPVFIPPGVIAELLAADCPQGLGKVWNDRPELCDRLPVNDEWVVRDVDRAEDCRMRPTQDGSAI